ASAASGSVGSAAVAGAGSRAGSRAGVAGADGVAGAAAPAPLPAAEPASAGVPPSRRVSRLSRSTYWSRWRWRSCSISCRSMSTSLRSSLTSAVRCTTRFCRSRLAWPAPGLCALSWFSIRVTRSARLRRWPTAGVAAARAATTVSTQMACRGAIVSADGVHDLDATVALPAVLVGLGADRTLLAVGNDGDLAGRTASALQRAGYGIAAALAQAQVVLAGAALVGIALEGHAGARAVTQVLGVAGHDGLELGTDDVLVEVEVDGALAQAAVGIQIGRGVAAVGHRRGLGRLDRLRLRFFLDLLRARSQGQGGRSGEQHAGGIVHGRNLFGCSVVLLVVVGWPVLTSVADTVTRRAPGRHHRPKPTS